MARNVVRLTQEENKYFHMNYDYMWQKLNTAPYYVNGSGECPRNINSPDLLPSYVNLSKCRNYEFVPSVLIVNKIVQFYNCNIAPEITTYQFLNEDLSLTDEKRKKCSTAFDDRFVGIYYGYYFDDSDKSKVIGSIIKIFEVNKTFRACVISGINTEAELYGPRLRNLINMHCIKEKNYMEYYNSLDISQRGITYYEGTVELTDRFLIIYLNGLDNPNRTLVITLSIEGFTTKEQYISGLSFTTLISDKFDVQFFLMGIARAYRNDLNPLSLADKKLEKILSINKGENEHITMTKREDNKWKELVIQNGKDNI